MRSHNPTTTLHKFKRRGTQNFS